MTPNCRDSCTSETGLSEVVGFVLILGVLVLVFSLYLTYGIPAQGRENEILHMNEVKDQFVSYKVSLDSLFNNNKVGHDPEQFVHAGNRWRVYAGHDEFHTDHEPGEFRGDACNQSRWPEPESYG